MLGLYRAGAMCTRLTENYKSQRRGASRVVTGRVEGALPHQPALPEHAEHLEVRMES